MCSLREKCPAVCALVKHTLPGLWSRSSWEERHAETLAKTDHFLPLPTLVVGACWKSNKNSDSSLPAVIRFASCKPSKLVLITSQVATTKFGKVQLSRRPEIVNRNLRIFLRACTVAAIASTAADFGVRDVVEVQDLLPIFGFDNQPICHRFHSVVGVAFVHECRWSCQAYL